MSKTRVWITLACCLFAVASAAQAQSGRKPGLWEITTTMTWQQSPFPPGMTMPASANSPFGGGPHTMQVCVTQAQIDKYGTVPPQARDCQVTNIQKGANSMTATIACTGHMVGNGTVEASWTDDEHSKSKVHFTGTMQMGPNGKTIEWTNDATSVFKSPSCGSVQPLPMPADK